MVSSKASYTSIPRMPRSRSIMSVEMCPKSSAPPIWCRRSELARSRPQGFDDLYFRAVPIWRFMRDRW